MRWYSVCLALHLIDVCAVANFDAMCALLVEQVPSHQVCDQAQAHCGMGQRAEAGGLQQARLPRCPPTPLLASLTPQRLYDTPNLLSGVAYNQDALPRCCLTPLLASLTHQPICTTACVIILQVIRLPRCCLTPLPASLTQYCLHDRPELLINLAYEHPACC